LQPEGKFELASLLHGVKIKAGVCGHWCLPFHPVGGNDLMDNANDFTAAILDTMISFGKAQFGDAVRLLEFMMEMYVLAA
jgi:hypothetical protein